MRAKLVLLVAVASLASMLTPSAASAQAPVNLPATCTQEQGGASVPVPCTVELVGFNDSGGTLSAALSITNDATGQTRRVSVPISAVLQQPETCTILELTLGPIDLFLLGIRVQTNEIHLLVTAQEGTLLGDLLCGLFFGNPTPGILNQALRDGLVTVKPPPA